MVETELPEDMEERRKAGIRHAEAILADCVKRVKEERAFLTQIRADYERRKAKTQAWQDAREAELQYGAAFATQVEAWEQANNMSTTQYDPERNKDIERPPVYTWTKDSIPRPSDEEIARDFLPDLEWNTKIAHKFPLLDAELTKLEGWGTRELSAFEEVWPSFQAAWNGEERWSFSPGASKAHATPFSSTAPLDWCEAFTTTPPPEMEHTPAWLHTKDWAGLVTEITALAEMGVSPFGAAMTAALAHQQSSYSEFHPDILNTVALHARDELLDKITNPNAPVTFSVSRLWTKTTREPARLRATPSAPSAVINGAPPTRARAVSTMTTTSAHTPPSTPAASQTATTTSHPSFSPSRSSPHLSRLCFPLSPPSPGLCFLSLFSFRLSSFFPVFFVPLHPLTAPRSSLCFVGEYVPEEDRSPQRSEVSVAPQSASPSLSLLQPTLRLIS